MPSGKYGKVTKVRVTTTLDIDTRERLERYSDISMINQSNIINKAVGDYLEGKVPAISDDINYSLGENGDAQITYKGKKFNFSIIDDIDGNPDNGERYIELNLDSEIIDVEQNAYNNNIFDEEQEVIQDTEEAEKDRLVKIINDYILENV